MTIALRFSLHNAHPTHYDQLTHLFIGLGWHPALPNAHYQWPPGPQATPSYMLARGQEAMAAFNGYMAGVAAAGVSVATFSLVFDEELAYAAIW